MCDGIKPNGLFPWHIIALAVVISIIALIVYLREQGESDGM